MWSSRTLLPRPFARSTRSGALFRKPGILSVSHTDEDEPHPRRYFTTDDKDKKKPFGKFSFDKDILQPAARGELQQKHDSGIPRLAGRHKARLGAPPKRSGGRFTKILKADSDIMQDDSSSWFDDDEAAVSDAPLRKKNLEAAGARTQTFSFDPRHASSSKTERAAQMDPLTMTYDHYYAPELLDDDRYYWNEEEFESLGDVDMDELDLKDGFFDIELDDSDAATQDISSKIDQKPIRPSGDDDDADDNNDFDNEDDDEEQDEDDRYNRRRPQLTAKPTMSETTNLEEQFFFGQNDVFEIAAMDEKLFGEKEEGIPDVALPLRPHGPGLDDFLEAMIEHPTKYAQIMSEQLHPDSKREPKPYIPRSRLNPPLEFVESHARFLFVSGLPPLEVNGEKGDISNPVHRDSVQKMIARLFNVDSDRVFPASTSSGFIGFPSPRALAEVLKTGANEPVLYSPASISMISADGDLCDFAKASPETTVEINGIPTGNTVMTLLHSLFPEGTEAGAVYAVKPEMVRFLSPTRALIRFESEEQAESAVVSQVLGHQLKSLGEYPVRLFRARRELVHAGFDGPYKMKEKRIMGPRLIVDGDMPSKKLYLSHARVIYLRNLDPNVSKDEIAAVFQPFSARPRDIKGSVEFVTCENGLSTGRAYVGFDIPGEAEQAMKALQSLAPLGDMVANMRLVKDRGIPGIALTRPEKRPERNAAELLDDLNNWERFVDPEDIRVLGEAGISRSVIDEALRGIRYNNASFSVFDASIRAEALQPEKMTGDLYKELVQMYVATLKDCIATPENVGELYESVHFPGEPIDLSIFEREKQRQKSLQDRRA